jgi:hypothetical protein
VTTGLKVGLMVNVGLMVGEAVKLLVGEDVIEGVCVAVQVMLEVAVKVGEAVEV